MSSEQIPAQRAAPFDPKRGSALLRSLARLAGDTLPPMLEGLFNACDDFFFDLASRAKSNQDQNLYFESLREIRLKKAAVITEFGNLIAARFAALEMRAAPLAGRKTAAQEPTAESLELVAPEQMEKDVLITGMVSNARVEYQQELFQIQERMLAISPRRFEEQDNPFEPACIAEAFVKASADIEIELQVQKLLYKQFDRHVMRELDELYHQANQILIEARVLPGLTPLARRKAKRHGAGAPAQQPDKTAAASSAQAAAAAEAFGIPEASPELQELSRLLQRLRSGGIRLPMFPDLGRSPDAPQMSKEELVSLLSDLQAHGEPAEPPDIRQALNALIHSRGQFRVGNADEDVINVVAMFFDLILEDRNLPIEIQALVSRLQLPILKVALKDRTFFTNRKHPARQLINQIAHTSIGWEASDKNAQDALFIRITELVEEVLRDSSEHAEVFERCLKDLMGFIEQSEQRAAKLERRTSEKLHADARNALANDMVRGVLHERLEGKELPGALSEFLVEHWRQVLRLVFLKQGKDSAEWMEAVQVVDDLIWSVQKHADERSRERQARLLPELYRRMAAGLEKTQSTPADVQARIEVIREIHRTLGSDQENPVPALPLTPEQEQKIVPTHAAEEKDRSWQEMTAVERQKVRYEALMFENLKRADEIPIGTWFLYDDLRRSVTRRCKLSSRIEETRTFMFVNRLGVQVYEKPRKAFAYDLQMGHARIIEDAPLFDRTIGRISANLRKLSGEE